MNKYTKWGIIGVIGVILCTLAYNAVAPHENKEMAEDGKSAAKGKQSKTINVRAVVLDEQALTDGIFVSGSLIPDEEVNLSFETSG